MPHPIWSARFWLAAILAATLLPSVGARADSLAEDNAKAGFIFNFTKYTEWPGAQAGSDLLVCSLSTQALSGKLESLQGRQVQGRAIRLHSPARSSEWRECQVIFITADDAQRIDTVLRSTAQSPVLTISDAPDFVQAGGIKLSSQLLKLADEVLP